MKRVSEDRTAASQPKVQRVEEDDTSQPDQAVEDESWALKSGMILEVKLRNFMCHEKYSFVPNQCLNFLCGENGSGKSAVLTAIVFGLGGTARMSNRGSSNKGFIRAGQTSATVEIKLVNTGDNCHKPEVFGESITVQRTVTQTSSSYKLKDSRGVVVQIKKVKEELDFILNRFNIQVENPMVVLNQDASKTFLAKSDPEKMYAFFHKSTRLKECEELYLDAENNKANCQISLAQKQESMGELKQESKKWTKKWEYYETLKLKNEEVTKLKGELAWGMVRDLEQKIEEESNTIAKEEKKIKKAEEIIDKTKSEDKELRTKKKEIEKEIQDIAEQQVPESKRLDGLKIAHTEKKRKLQQATRAVNEANRKIEKHTRSLQQITEEIEKYKSGACKEYEEKRLVRSQELQELEAETEALTAQLEVSGNHLLHLKANNRQTEDSVSAARYAATGTGQKLKTLKSELNSLKLGEKNKLIKFGDWMPPLVEEIKRQQHKFSKVPIGPLGAYINLKENLSSEVASILEVEVSGLINAFCVDSSQDQKILYNIFNQLRLPTRPEIITSKFSSEPYDISKNRVTTSNYKTLVDCFETSNPTVFNTLIDNCQLEKIIIIPQEAAAQQLLKTVETVPRNLRYAVVASKYQYFPAPNYCSYFKEYRSRNLLKSSIEDLMAGFEQQIKEQELELTAAQEERKKFEEALKVGLGLVKAEEKKIAHIRKDITKKNTRTETLKAEEFADKPPDIAALEDDKEKYTEELVTYNKDLEEAKTNQAMKSSEEEEARLEMEALDNILSANLEKIEPLKASLTKTEDGIRRKKSDIDYYNGKIKEYRGHVTQHTEDRTKKEEELQEEIKRAKHWNEERMTTKRAVESLKVEVFKLQENLKKLTENMEPREVVKENFNKYKQLLLHTEKELAGLKQMMIVLDQAIKTRKKGYRLILRITSQNVERNFTKQLNVRQYVGNLAFNHHDKTLHIKVNPCEGRTGAGLNIDRDLKSLSGGERSYTMVAFILSLWHVMEAPFRILDEFDVFMDAINRRIAVSNIINNARAIRKNQFVFLTPLDTTNIAVGDDLKIIKLCKLKP